MNSETKRTVLLLSVLGVVAALVLLDRLSGDPADSAAETSGAAGEAPSSYRSQAARLAGARAEVEAGASWREAGEAAREAWDARRARMITAPSAEIAAARLRAMIEPALRDEGLSIQSSETLAARRASEDGRLAVVGLSLSFRSTDLGAVYRVLDRIEELPEAETSVEAVSLRGPGRIGRGGGVEATARVRAAAWVEGGAARG